MTMLPSHLHARQQVEEDEDRTRQGRPHQDALVLAEAVCHQGPMFGLSNTIKRIMIMMMLMIIQSPTNKKALLL